MTPQELVAQLQQRKENNIAFFKKHFPSIGLAFEKHSLSSAQLNIDPTTLEVNLLENGQALYPANVQSYNQNEALEFSNAFKAGSTNHPIARSQPEHFRRGRYSHGCIANFLEEVSELAGEVKTYTFEHSLPQVVFLGSGLGLHIQELLKLRTVRHAVVVEHNPDHFFASFYMVDWQTLILPFLNDPTRSFKLSLADIRSLNEEEKLAYSADASWHTYCNNVPFMPVQTVLYIHRGDSYYARVAERLNSEIQPFVQGWGFYDDEINQANNVFHNIEQGIRVLKKQDLSHLTKPVIVCGNGPSLDAYLPIIKKYRDKLHIVAAGTGTHSLLENDLYPDFMVTVESDYVSYYHLNKQLNPEKAKLTPIIGAAQITPMTFDFFGEGLMYLKGETTLAKLFEKDQDTFHGGVPTATNSAFALVMDMNPSKVFLVGMDFGFLDPHKTHSDSSFYLNNQKQFANYTQKIAKDAFKLETKALGDVYTTPFYNSGRFAVQQKIRECKRDDIINLTKGASIENTIEFSEAEFDTFLQAFEVDTNEPSLFSVLKKKPGKITLKDRDKAYNQILAALKKLKKDCLEIINSLEPNLERIEQVVYLLNQAITHSKDPQIEKLNAFMRGTIWHWIHNYYALCKEEEAEPKLATYTAAFKQRFAGFLYYLPDHFESFLSDMSMKDIKLKKWIGHPEPNIEEWLNKANEKYHDR